jgi:hypothetical protein
MKVTNWRRKLMQGLVAAGVLVPSASYAVNIPLGDPSFENYVVSPGLGYAYAQNPGGAYRPASPWVDDLDSPPGFAQDSGGSNWLYNAAYAELATNSRRAAPHTGNQAMHGLTGNFNAQELANVFEANKTYTFSIWAQNDEILNETNGIGVYIFDGTVLFNPLATSGGVLAGNSFTTTVPQRAAGMTAVQSQANWAQFSITHTVAVGAPEVGHPIGVGFRAFKDSAVDDATLTAVDAVTQVLYLEVNTTNGQTRLRNQTGATVNIDYYEVTSASGALNKNTWSSFQDQNLAGFPAGNGTGNGWEEAGGSSSTVIGESYLTGNSGVANAANIALGNAYTLGGSHDLQFKYGAVSSVTPATGDFNNNGVVDAADYVLWRNGGPLQNDPTPGVQAADYTIWRTNFGNTASAGPSTLITGAVLYVTSASAAAVPEPSAILLVGIGGLGLAGVSRRKKLNN